MLYIFFSPSIHKHMSEITYPRIMIKICAPLNVHTHHVTVKVTTTNERTNTPNLHIIGRLCCTGLTERLGMHVCTYVTLCT